MSKSGSGPRAPKAPYPPDVPGAGWDSPECQLVLQWVEAFNDHDLDGMLSCMSPAVTFQPLRLHGIERTYVGYDGVARWHERLMRLRPDYRMRVDELSIPVAVTVLAIGRLSLEDLDNGAPLWGVHTIDEGLIVTARHCLGDADLAHQFALQ